MTPRPSRRVFQAAWIMSRAFTPHPALAVAAHLWAFMSIVPGTARGGQFLDPSRTGMMLLYRSMMAGDVLIAVPLNVAFVFLIGAATVALSALLPGTLATAIMPALSIVGALLLLPRGGGALLPWAPRPRRVSGGRSRG